LAEIYFARLTNAFSSLNRLAAWIWTPVGRHRVTHDSVSGCATVGGDPSIVAAGWRACRAYTSIAFSREISWTQLPRGIPESIACGLFGRSALDRLVPTELSEETRDT